MSQAYTLLEKWVRAVREVTDFTPEIGIVLGSGLGVSYATIYLSVREVKEYTPVAEQTLWEKISSGFLDSLKGLGTDIVNFFAWIVIKLPYLVVYGLILWGLGILIRRWRRRRAARKAVKKANNTPTKAPDDSDKENNS